MVETMEAFGQGFFGRDSDKQFSMVIAIEAPGINATVCKSHRCDRVSD